MKTPSDVFQKVLMLEEQIKKLQKAIGKQGKFNQRVLQRES